MPSVISSIRPTTELEAINVMLGAIGEAKLPANTDLSAVTDASVEQAVEILRESTREVLTAGWRFNSLTGFELKPVGTQPWADSEGVTTTLNVFQVPAEVLAWSQTPCAQMSGLDIIERKNQDYGALTLFDRVRNRPGATATRLYIEAIFAADFADMPECARRYATVAAARRLAQRVGGGETEARFTQQDEMQAYRTLKREQGLSKNLNLFNTADAREVMGRRPAIGGGFQTRVYPGGV